MRKFASRKADIAQQFASPRLAPAPQSREHCTSTYWGNQAALRISRTSRRIQTKLQVGATNDPLEAEADRVADRVMRMADPAPPARESAGTVRRMCSECKKEEEEKRPDVQRKSATVGGSGGPAPDSVQDVVSSGGKPLGPAERGFFEPRLNAGLENVRIHADAHAASSANSIGAQAFTVGNHIAFGAGKFAPGTHAGKRLLAHELAHTLQQSGAPRTNGPSFGARTQSVTAAPTAVSRAVVDFGKVQANVDYGDLIKIAPADYEKTVESRYASYSGKPLDPVVVRQIQALPPSQIEWLLYALDLLSENTATAPALDRAKAFQRLIDRAPVSKTRALGSAKQDFEREVLVESGWAEEAISGGLPASTASENKVIDPLLNPPPDSSAPPAGKFDEATFKLELPGLTKAVFSASQANPANWPGVRKQPIADVRTIGDLIQAQALSFFAPYAGTARDNRWLTGWQYSQHISSVTTDDKSQPLPITKKDRIGLMRNRATMAGQSTAKGPSLFSRTNFDEKRDAKAMDQVLESLDQDPAMQKMAEDVSRHTGHFDPNTNEVAISTEVSATVSECDMRWKTIRTLCHELMHSLAHPDFSAAAESSPRFPNGVTFDQALIEGCAEVLGVELFKFLREQAAQTPALLTQLTSGLSGACAAPQSAVTPGYQQGGANAQTIHDLVGEDRFRAAFLHGKTSLIGL